MTQKEFNLIAHRARYIDWRGEATEIELSVIDFHKKLEEIRSTLTRITTLDGGRTIRDNFPDNCYDEYVPRKYRKKQYRIYCRINNKYFIYKSHRYGKTINKEETKSPYDIVLEKFRDRTSLGREAMSKAFGTVAYEYRACVPIPLCYFNPLYATRDPENMAEWGSVNSIDGCSQYPTALCDRLPTAEGKLEFKGTVEPTEDYPFALYLKSGHTAVYGEFDTHNWEKHLWGPIIFRHKNTKLDPADDITILMKESNFTFKDEMEHFFNIKETFPKDSAEREEAKLVMNAFIGTMWMNHELAYARRPYAHLVAIAQARALQRMLDKLDQIHFQRVIHICVDGIIYMGGPILGTTERKLGNFEQEFSNASMVIREYNTYIVKDETGKVIKSKHGSYNIYDDGTEIKQLRDYPELFMIRRTDNSSDYDRIKEYKEGKL